MSNQIEQFESKTANEKNAICHFENSAELLGQCSNNTQAIKDATNKLVCQGALPNVELHDLPWGQDQKTQDLPWGSNENRGDLRDFRPGDIAGTGRYLDRKDDPLKDLADKLNGPGCRPHGDGKAQEQPAIEHRQQETPRLREHRAERQGCSPREQEINEMMRELRELARRSRY